MNEISTLYNFVIELFKANKLVNTISILDTELMDLNKENIYPLVNIDLTNTEVLNDVIIGKFTITIVQARDIYPTVTDSKLLSNTNYIDNINETHFIATKFINYITRQNNDFNIELDNLADITILKEWRTVLDGVQFDIDLIIPNLGQSC